MTPNTLREALEALRRNFAAEPLHEIVERELRLWKSWNEERPEDNSITTQVVLELVLARLAPPAHGGDAVRVADEMRTRMTARAGDPIPKPVYGAELIGWANRIEAALAAAPAPAVGREAVAWRYVFADGSVSDCYPERLKVEREYWPVGAVRREDAYITTPPAEAREPVGDVVPSLADAARNLLRLKDGPRDDTYARTKHIAWDNLRRALAQLRDTPRDSGDAVLREFYDAFMADNATGQSRERFAAARDRAATYLAAMQPPTGEPT